MLAIGVYHAIDLERGFSREYKVLRKSRSDGLVRRVGGRGVEDDVSMLVFAHDREFHA